MSAALALLFTAIGLEVAATASLPRAQGFTNLPWTAAVLAGYAASVWLLTLVVRSMPVSVAYAIWSGVGTAVVAVVGALFLGEGMSAVKLAALALIVGGVVILNLAGA